MNRKSGLAAAGSGVESRPVGGNKSGSGKFVTAARVSRLTSSPVREILRMANRSDIISFAGGLPDQESLPDIALGDFEQSALQYGATEGEDTLRQWIADDLAQRGLVVSAEQVLILSGSQQGIDLVAKMFVSERVQVAVESPTYLAALQVFNLFGGQYLTFSPGSCKELAGVSPTLTYCIPTFQNPTGYCYTAAERQTLAGVCDVNGSVLFEDDPYRDLVYDECDRRPICSYLKSSEWIYQSSFSKILAPGLRLGYLVCSPALYPTLCWLKQAADLHSNRLSQQLVLSLVQLPRYASRLQKITAGYRQKRNHFDMLLRRYFSGLACWEKPAGGLFFWLQLSSAIDTDELLQAGLERGVAFMPGEHFFAENNQSASYLRLNFSHADQRQSDKGLKILADLVKAQYKCQQESQYTSANTGANTSANTRAKKGAKRVGNS